ncbi:MAG: DUF559 domain-containing protein [Myxococcales bacterium]|nr:DUF559 domain-containing protein [Myxococcales bacterium]
MSRKLTQSHVIEERARTMRFAQTPTEEALWRELRGGKLGAVVRRQYVVGRYIADFAAPAVRVVIEYRWRVPRQPARGGRAAGPRARSPRVARAEAAGGARGQ